MKEFDHVVLKFDDHGKGIVSVNGHELKSTMNVSFEARGGEVTFVTICMVASVEADVVAKVVYAPASSKVSGSPLKEFYAEN